VDVLLSHGVHAGAGPESYHSTGRHFSYQLWVSLSLPLGGTQRNQRSQTNKTDRAGCCCKAVRCRALCVRCVRACGGELATRSDG
jgi:hypothetical protein